MHRKKVVLCSLFGLLLVGCMATIDNHYMLLSQDTRTPAVSYAQIVASPTSTPLVSGETARHELSEASPLLNIDGNRSVYELFSFEANANQEFHLIVDGMVMPGLSQSQVVPLVVVVDERGAVLPVSFERHQHGLNLTDGTSMKATIIGRAVRRSVLYVVVMADNRHAGKAVGRVAELPVYPSPFGPIRVALMWPSD